MSQLVTMFTSTPYLYSTVTSYRQVTMMTRCLVMVPRVSPPVTTPSLCLHTSQTFCLRKAPKSQKLFGVDMWWRYIPWPSYLLKAMIRKKVKPEDLGPDEAHRKSIFHRLSLLYVFLTWSGFGIATYLFMQPRKDPKSLNLPHQEEINRGGAMYWIQALKSPDEMQDLKKMKVVRLSGLSFKGVEDVTIMAKDIGQEKNRRLYDKSDDHFLRKRLDILPVEEGGPSNQELREQFIAEGRDFELELDYSNIRARRRTNYNPDGTVGSFVTSGDYERGNRVPEPDKEEVMAM